MDVVTRTVVQLLALVFCCCLLAGPGSHAHQMHEEWQCGHDQTDFMHDVTYRVHLESEHHHVKKRALDQPFRVAVHYDSTVDTNLSPAATTRIKNTITKLTQFLETTLTVRPLGESILFDRRCGGSGTFFLPPEGSDVRMCVEQCIQTTCGSTGIVIPDEHLKRCIQCNGNGFRNCETVGSDGAGVDADYVLYVSAVTASSCPVSQNSASNTLGFGGFCQTEDEFDRPIGGFVNFCPVSVNDIEDDDYLFAVAKHEVLHGLAFSSGLFAFWRDEDGEPRTARNSNGFPPIVNGQYAAGTTTVQQVTYTDWQTRNGPVSHTVNMLVTPRITEEARAHFNCSTLQGMELENEGGSGTAMSHWERRLVEYEAMAGIITSNPVFSRLTFALLEDSGWYGVNYSNADHLLWGRGSGCELSSGSCGGYIETKISQGESISPFCNQFDGNSASGCTVRRDAISSCNLAQFISDLPTEYQYFDSTNVVDAPSGVVFSRVGANSQLSDFCPIQQGFSNTVCDDPSNDKGSGTSNIFAQTYGEGSRCVLTSGVWTVRQVGSLATFTSTSSAAGCYQYGCSNGQVTIYVFGQSYLCSFAGEQKSVDVTHEGFIYTGTIICPSCLEICYDDFENCPEAAALFGVSSTIITEPTSTSVSTITSVAPSTTTSTSTTTVSSTSTSTTVSSTSTTVSSTSTSTTVSSTSTSTMVSSTTSSTTTTSSSSTTTITTSSSTTGSSTSTSIAPSTTTSSTTTTTSSSTTGSSTTTSVAPSTTSSSSTSTTDSTTSSIAPSTTTTTSSSTTVSSTSSSTTVSSTSSSTTTTGSSTTSSIAPSTSSTTSSIAPSTSSTTTTTSSSTTTSIAPSTTTSSTTTTTDTSSTTTSSSSTTGSSTTTTGSSSTTTGSSSSSSSSSILRSSTVARSSVVRTDDIVPEPTSDILDESGSASGDGTDGSAALFSFWLVGLTILLHTIIATLMWGCLV